MTGNNKDRVVIIGGGIAGLSAGIYALKAGFDAVIYEKNSIPGGECIGWNRKGFHIDNCIHWLTGTKKGTDLYEVWKTTGAISDGTEYADIDSFYTSSLNGQKATLWNDLKKTEEELIGISPEDEEEIKKFIQYTEYAKQCLIPASKPMEMWGIGDYISMGKDMADFPKVMKEFGKISLDEYSRRFYSPLLRKLICDYLPKEYCVYSLMVSYATMADGNGKIPMGASLQMSLRMEKRFKELGGKIFYNTGVEKIVLEKKKAIGIKLENGEFVNADFAIPTLDTYPLFKKLLPEKYMPKALATAYGDQKTYPAISGFQLAFTVRDSFETEHTQLFDIEPLKVGSGTYDRMYIKSYGYDPLFVHDGRVVIQTSIIQSDDDFKFWKNLSPEEYAKEKEKLIGEVAKRVVTNFPELEGDLEFLDCWTPLTYERYCNAYHGSYMCFTTTPESKTIRLKGKLKGIDNIYLAGQWTMPPGGLPIAVVSGKFAIQRILKGQKRDINI
ncbi:MAG: NAD(P)/FAD-dependent oxidoreductase [Lachnospiraceae bacterium]|nr:NAD(P)/FAD-dependent oxidoreductase [Lachnospiraceae bacterium]